MGLISAIVWLIVGLIALSLALSMIVITPQRHVKVLETFGKYSGYRKAGLSFKAPWPIQAVSAVKSLQTMEISQEVSVMSADNASVILPIRIQMTVDESDVEAATYKLDNPAQQIKSYVTNQVRATAGRMKMIDLFKARDAFKDDIEQELSAKMAECGYRIIDVLVDDPQPSAELRAAFERVLASERLKEAAINEAEANKTMLVATAKAEAESVREKGKGLADFRNTIAEGQSAAMKKFMDGTDLTHKDALSFMLAVNEMEALTTVGQSGGKVIFVTGSAGGRDNSPAMFPLLAANLEPGSAAPKSAAKPPRKPSAVKAEKVIEAEA